MTHFNCFTILFAIFDPPTPILFTAKIHKYYNIDSTSVFQIYHKLPGKLYKLWQPKILAPRRRVGGHHLITLTFIHTYNPPVLSLSLSLSLSKNVLFMNIMKFCQIREYSYTS